MLREVKRSKVKISILASPFLRRAFTLASLHSFKHNLNNKNVILTVRLHYGCSCTPTAQEKKNAPEKKKEEQQAKGKNVRRKSVLPVNISTVRALSTHEAHGLTKTKE
ncbi:unnamed protein product [Oikopleura dioica]|uniref:Uncharacterized protein n=1 Tax=Oikopleura dioica TaxID=34765 RepID=E4X224_OIKDI|nr:unnamed protein product [Oikopleura dioica]